MPTIKDFFDEYNLDVFYSNKPDAVMLRDLSEMGYVKRKAPNGSGHYLRPGGGRCKSENHVH